MEAGVPSPLRDVDVSGVGWDGWGDRLSLHGSSGSVCCSLCKVAGQGEACPLVTRARFWGCGLMTQGSLRLPRCLSVCLSVAHQHVASAAPPQGGRGGGWLWAWRGQLLRAEAGPCSWPRGGGGAVAFPGAAAGVGRAVWPTGPPLALLRPPAALLPWLRQANGAFSGARQ